MVAAAREWPHPRAVYFRGRGHRPCCWAGCGDEDRTVVTPKDNTSLSTQADEGEAEGRKERGPPSTHTSQLTHSVPPVSGIGMCMEP